LEAGADKTTGLVADRQTTTGSPTGSYAFDACRTPWRIALDYLWNGNEKAKAWCIKVSNFAYKFGIKNIKEGFSLSGSSSGGWHSMAYTGGFAIAAMANSQAMVDEFGTDLKTIHDTYWFTFTLTPCYLLTFTGNQWPEKFTGVAGKTNLNRVSNTRIQWKLLQNRELSINGLKSGYSISITDLSGRNLFNTTAASTGTSIDISKTKTGCVILTITDKNKNIVTRNKISIL
jgi:hypothetical protein